MRKKFMLAVIAVSMLIGAAPSLAVDIDAQTSNVIVSGNADSAKTTATIILKNKTTGDIAYIAEAGIANGKYYKKFKFPLANPSDYTLSVNSGGEDITQDVLSAVYHSSKLDNVISFDGNNKYFTEGDLISIRAKVKNLYADEENYKIYFACYDDGGKLIGAVSGGTNQIGYGGDGEEYTSESLNTSVPSGTAMIKAFAWTDNLLPIDTAKEQKIGDKSYQDKDVVSFMGDSITHIGIYPYFIEHYYQTRYPQRSITFHNKGISGQTAGGVYSRLDWDIFSEGTNRATLMIGVNDIYPQFKTGTTQGEAAIEECIANYKKVIDKCKENNVEITLVTPPLADIKDSAAGINKEQKVNDGLKQLSERIKALADKEGIGVYDINTMTNDITDYGNSLGESRVIQSADGIHPTNTGYTIIGYCYLKEQGEDSVVANTEISKQDVSTVNCEVCDVNYTETGVTFAYAPKSSPLAANSSYNNALRFVPTLTKDLNEEIIKVSDLPDGNYTLRLGDSDAGTYTAAQLANGINIAVLESNPNQQRAKSAYEKLMLKDNEVDKLRAIAETISCKGNYDLDTESGYNAFLEKNKNHAYIGMFKQYGTYKPIENEIKAAAKQYADEAAELSKPISYVVSLIKN